jgi:predicted XRE-type DNA-binding protein
MALFLPGMNPRPTARLRSALMHQIAAIIEKSGWTQAEAAEALQRDQPPASTACSARLIVL